MIAADSLLRIGLTPAFGLAFALIVSVSPGETAAAQSVAERVQVCGACHGADGVSQLEKIPSLAGQPEFYLLNQLVLIREGVRTIAVMQDVLKGISDADIQGLAAHYAKLPPGKTSEPIDAVLAAKGRALAPDLQCPTCHKPDLSGQQQMPRLAGQRLDYLREALHALRDGGRGGADALMVEAILGRSDADLEALAQYAASLAPTPTK